MSAKTKSNSRSRSQQPVVKALTIRQPFIWEILQGLKKIEYRSWPPPEELVGQRIAIHAAKRRMTAAEEEDVRPVNPPVPCTGQLGLWNVPSSASDIL